MPGRLTIENAPSGEKATLDGAEKFPISGSQWALVSSIKTYLNIVTGVYSPTRSAESNLDSSVTMSEAQYMRVGSTVTVSGRFTADPTAGGAASFEFTLPIASNLGAVEDCAGVAFAGGIAGQGAAILGSVANNTAVVNWVAVDTTSKAWSYTLSYQII
jgi:hypothetical protein